MGYVDVSSAFWSRIKDKVTLSSRIFRARVGRCGGCGGCGEVNGLKLTTDRLCRGRFVRAEKGGQASISPYLIVLIVAIARVWRDWGLDPNGRLIRLIGKKRSMEITVGDG